MRKDHVFLLRTLRALLVFFDNYADVIEKYPLLKEDVAAFRALVNRISDMVDPENAIITISTASKSALRTGITERVLNAFGKIKAQAIKDKNEDLKKEATLIQKTFQAPTDADFLEVIREKVKMLQNHAGTLAKYGLNKAYLAELTDDVETFSKALPKMSVEKSQSKVATGTLQDAVKEAKEYLDDVLVHTVEMTANEFPVFVKEFNEVKTGQTPSVSPTSLVLIFIDDATNLPCLGVRVINGELKFSEVTDETGKLVIKTGAKKDLIFSAVREGMVAQEIKMGKIKKGQVLEMEIRMVAVPTA